MAMKTQTENSTTATIKIKMDELSNLVAQRDALREACKEARYYAGLARDEFRAGISPIATLDRLTDKVKAALALCEPKDKEGVKV